MSRRLQIQIHVGCKQLGIDEDMRRDLQQRVTGKTSMSDMDEAELKLVVNELKTKGFVAQKTSKSKRKPAPRADLRLVHVLWGKLGEAGKLDRPGRDGLNAFVRSRFEKTWGSVPADIDMLRDWAKIDALIQALLQWCEREGVELDRERLGR